MRRLVFAIVLTASLTAGTTPLGIDPAIVGVLTHSFKFSSSDFADLSMGKVVKHTLDTEAAGEIAAVGAVQINSPLDVFLTEFRDIEQFKTDDDVLQIGRFSDPPAAEDLKALTIGGDDFRGETCRVGDCDVRLPSQDIVRLQRDIDWTAPDADARAADLFKQMLLDDVRAYWTGAPGRMTVYADGRRPIRPIVEFEGILRNSPYIGQLIPGLPAHLEGFPDMRLAHAEDFLYWSKERFGIAPFITVTHVTIARAESGAAVITSKDVYSSRYFDSSLGMTVAMPAEDGTFLLLYVNRSRANALKGIFSALRRAMVERRASASLEESLKAVKARLEAH